MMKRIFAWLLILGMVLGMSACKQENTNDLMEDVPDKTEDVLVDLEAGNGAAANFAVELFKTAIQDGKNTLISPLSVLYALSMTANGADGETLDQMEQVLGMKAENLNEYMLSYMDQLPEAKEYKLRLANSIWFKDDPNFMIEESFLQTNADYYGSGVYKAHFDHNTRKDINDWVNTHTDGMIPEIVDDIPEEAIVYLVNALAFDAQWEDVYNDYQIHSSHFTKEDGTQQDVELMHSEEHRYLEDEKATGFIKYYEGRKYAFVALLPKEGLTVGQYVDGLTGGHIRRLLAAPEDIRVITAIPKFETQYRVELGDVLCAMGMENAFDVHSADFSRLGTYNVEGMNICINRVLHKTYIFVGEQGTSAGAATAVEMVAGAALDPQQPQEIREVILNRPFVYMLIDCETNLPFFLGTMMDVGN